MLCFRAHIRLRYVAVQYATFLYEVKPLGEKLFLKLTAIDFLDSSVGLRSFPALLAK